MYKKIRSHPTTLEIYGKKLVGEGVVTEGEVEKMRADWRARLDVEQEASQGYKPNNADWLDGRWAGMKSARDADDPRRGNTGVAIETLKEIGATHHRGAAGLPRPSHHSALSRRRAPRRSIPASASIGRPPKRSPSAHCCSKAIRCACPARTSERGTFSQRHSVLIDQENENRYTPFNEVQPTQARYEVINSMLSEEAVLGFEYGYSLAEPNALTLWEAQFGDFANGAQVLFDQFISSGERKWLRMSGLVCLLPHGYEGQGPEHSSARLERFLQMCAEDNMQVANCTTPANYFHILRRQLKREIRKPLILMTPKSLLRHKRATSRLDELATGTSFHRVLWDDAQLLPDEKIKLVPDDKIRRVVLCSGKVYFDLYEEREKRGIDDIYLLRVEQLYPFPTKARGAGTLPLRAGRDGVVPGRAAQHGRVALRRALSRMGAQSDRSQAPPAALCHASGLGLDRGRPDRRNTRRSSSNCSTRRSVAHDPVMARKVRRKTNERHEALS